MDHHSLPKARVVISGAPLGNIGHTVHIYDEVQSTNALLYDHTSKSTPSHGTAIVARYQSHGKGQIGRNWHSRPSLNLLTSILLRPQRLRAEQQYLLNIVVSLAVRDYLADLHIADVKIKWPNDIYVGSSKIAGILTQCSLQGSEVQHVVVGIGLNVNQRQWPDALPNPTSIYSSTGTDYDTIELAAGLYSYLEKRYQHLVHEYQLVQDYHEHLYQRDQEHYYEINGMQRSGMIVGINNSGELLMRWSDGSSSAYRHGEIKYLAIM